MQPTDDHYGRAHLWLHMRQRGLTCVMFAKAMSAAGKARATTVTTPLLKNAATRGAITAFHTCAPAATTWS